MTKLVVGCVSVAVACDHHCFSVIEGLIPIALATARINAEIPYIQFVFGVYLPQYFHCMYMYVYMETC